MSKQITPAEQFVQNVKDVIESLWERRHEAHTRELLRVLITVTKHYEAALGARRASTAGKAARGTRLDSGSIPDASI